MVRGAEYAFTFTVRNKTTGEPITDNELVSGIELVLRSSAIKGSLKKYELDSGIEALGAGRYKVTVSDEDSLLLPPSGRAFLEGFTSPVKRSIKLDLGPVTDNQANYPVHG